MLAPAALLWHHGRVETSRKSLTIGLPLEPADALWKRVPTRDADGRPLSDFMMILPGLRERPHAHIAETLAAIELTLHRYGEAVVFADFNLKLNLLWVSVKPIPGICLELPAALQACAPEALLVADRVSVPSAQRRWPRVLRRLLGR